MMAPVRVIPAHRSYGSGRDHHRSVSVLFRVQGENVLIAQNGKYVWDG